MWGGSTPRRLGVTNDYQPIAFRPRTRTDHRARSPSCGRKQSRARPGPHRVRRGHQSNLARGRFAIAPFCPRVMTPPRPARTHRQKMCPAIPCSTACTASATTNSPLLNTGAWSLIQDLREQHKIGEFLIVTPDGGRTFYINSRDGRVRYSDFFLQEFMPSHRAPVPRARGAKLAGHYGDVDGRLWSPALCFCHIRNFFPR